MPHATAEAVRSFGFQSIKPAYGIFSIVILAPWAFVGFEVTSFDTAHFRFSQRKTGLILLASILMAGFAYASMTLVSISSLPGGYASWQEYIADLGVLNGVTSVPTFYAAEATMGIPGLAIITLTALAAILTGIIGAFRAMVRVLSTMAEDKILSERFQKTTYSIFFIMALTIMISLLGRNTLNWFVDLTSFGAIVAYGYTCAAAYRIAKTENNRKVMAVGLIGTITMYYIAVKTNVSGSEYIAFNSAYGTVSGAFSALMSVAISVARIKPILEMADPILKAEPETSENKQMVTSLKGGIELSNVYFRYTESMPYVVNNMSLRIRPGEYIAIVGKTGCGKSTLVRLLLGFETPERGSIYYDGKDMTKLDLRSLRCRIGTVTQDGSLFQGDIYSNIVISSPNLPLDAAWEAAELAGIADDIRAMPMGMQTMISEGSGGISGGQKQRLMIARAVAPKPKILIFDEATSALDNRTQKQVSDALDRLKCTRIVIAHRLSTIKNCDRILVLDEGRILEDGTYVELIAKQGYFAELVERQRLDTGNPVSAQKT